MSKAEKTRQFIVEKTAPIFNTKGYAGTSLNDMTEATGLTKGSIYGNFANKDEVALACFDYNFRQQSAAIQYEMEKADNYRDKLMVYTRFLDRSAPGLPFGGCPILNTAVEADDTHPDLKARSANAIIAWKNRVADLLSKGIENQEFKKDLDVEKMAISIIALLEGAIMITKATGKSEFRDAIMGSLADIIHSL